MGGYAFEVDLPGQGSIFSSFLADDKQRRVTITPEGVLFLLEHAPDIIPYQSIDSLDDRSKSDWFSKTILVLQLLSFSVNLLDRWIQGVPVSLLEISTLAHCACSCFTLLVWWAKPRGILQPTLIRASSGVTPEVGAPVDTAPSDSLARKRESEALAACAIMMMCSRLVLYSCVGLIIHASKRVELDYLIPPEPSTDSTLVAPPSSPPQDLSSPYIKLNRSPLAKDSAYTPTTFISIPADGPPNPPRWLCRSWTFDPMPWYAQRLPQDMANDAGTLADVVEVRKSDLERWNWAMRVPEPAREACHALASDGSILVTPDSSLQSWMAFNDWRILCFLLLPVLYGGVHLAGWNGPFQSLAEQALWRAACLYTVSSTILTFIVTLVMITAFTFVVRISGIQRLQFWSLETLFDPIFTVLCAPLYLSCNIYILVACFRQLSHLPPEAYSLPSWVNSLPHIS